jgi:hypothetical protein
MALPRKGNPLLRLNSISPYYTMFPVDFPLNVLKDAKRGQWVLDPFCGRGTTNFAARLLGLPSVGIDSNPVAAAIAAAKLVDITPREIVALCRRILRSGETPADVPEGQFWSLCYAPRTLEQICAIRQALLSTRRSPARTALRALMLGLLHGPRYKGSPGYLSNQMPRTYSTKPEPAVRYWTRRALAPKEVDILELVARRAEFTFSQVPAKADGAVYQGDSRSATYPRPHGGFNWIVTSPPYWGMRSYWPDQWLRNWFLGGPSCVAYPANDQAGRGNLREFERGMASVWINCARAAARGACLAIRFGALPCQRVDPLEVIDRSFCLADCGWRRTGWRAAGAPRRGSRQAEQFQKKSGASIEEVDIFAVLET